MGPGFFWPAAAWAFLLIVPLVALYFLKLRRPQRAVPSLLLWRSVVEDQRVNSPFQRFRRNLLLWLQLLALCALILAAMQPFLRGGPGLGLRYLALVDGSASMQALDREGHSRLDRAKERLRSIVDGLGSDQELAVVRFANAARLVQGFTSNGRLLSAAVDRLEVEEVEGDLEAGLRMAQAMARAQSIDRVILLSDGNFPAQLDFALPFPVEFQRVGEPLGNVGVVALRALRSGDGAVWRTLVSLAANDHATGACTLVVSVGEEELLRQELSYGPGERRDLELVLDGALRGEVEFRLLGTQDVLACDDVAYLSLVELRPLRVGVDETLLLFREALEVQTDLQVVPLAAGSSRAGYDLLITRDAADLGGAPVVLCVGALPADLASLVVVEQEPGQVTDWNRNTTLLDHVEWGDVLWMDRVRWQEEDGLSKAEQLDYSVWVDGAEGPVMLARERGDRQEIVLVLDVERSTLPYRVGFPVMLANLSQLGRRAAGLEERSARPTGAIALPVVTPGATASVRTPQGQVIELLADGEGRLGALSAEHVGRYALSGASDAEFATSLLSSEESSLRAVEEVQFPEATIAMATVKNTTERSLWPWLAAIALLGWLVEWWFYSRPPLRVRVESGS